MIKKHHYRVLVGGTKEEMVCFLCDQPLLHSNHTPINAIFIYSKEEVKRSLIVELVELNLDNITARAKAQGDFKRASVS